MPFSAKFLQILLTFFLSIWVFLRLRPVKGMSQLARVAFFLSLLPLLHIPGLFEFVPLLALTFSLSLGNHDKITVTTGLIQIMAAPAGAILGTVALNKIVTRKEAIRGFGLASWAVFLGITSLILWWTDFHNLLYSLPAWKSFLRGHL